MADFDKGAVSANGKGDDGDRAVKVWRIKKLIKGLEAAKGNGTSMISLIIPPRDQISRVNRLLADEYGTASNIKSRVNRQSVLSAITSTQQRLKLYTRMPKNGLVIYCGTVITDDNKEKQVTFDFEPFKPINTSLYHCDNRFHTEALSSLLESDEKFGFIIMDGNGALFGLLTGSTRNVLHKFSVDLPKKHGRGGQSALRFARLREEKRHNFVRKVAETAVIQYIPDGQKVNVTGLILAGSADFKSDLQNSDIFDPRLKAKVLKVVDVSYGGENGFNQAIDLSAETLSNVKFIQEKKLVQKYFDQISKDPNKCCFGVVDTMRALENGAVETLIIWEDMAHMRYTLLNPQTNEKIIRVLNKEEMEDAKNFQDKETKAELDVVDAETMPFVEWMADHYSDFGTTLEFVTDRSQEGVQFVRGFGGIGGLLRYELNFEVFEEPDNDDFDEDDFF
eukprot:Plantae.Rhodophyta-Hildenbrandia_rubra.ctg7338.p1 GENE.Plantae.Rhodophyta-Hildenbrandia_rubra.ctg7338~~Plantae.Rhodophyta-Hildenbrandia_rubra.ctg7338.p1  ORF type:complete len:450 (-),score=101.79 Plantae.Rhodophyta-Hildenbrandia_rubra.ctg7338:2059-3408(-)